MHHSGERWTGIERGTAGGKIDVISGHRVMFRAGITSNVRQRKQFSLPVGQSMSYHIDYSWVYEKKSIINNDVNSTDAASAAVCRTPRGGNIASVADAFQ